MRTMLSEKQYERVARWLDGEAVELTEAERRAGESIRREERAVKAWLATAPPTEAVRRAKARMTAELARPRSRVWRRAAMAVGAAAAIAAAVLLATRVGPRKRTETPRPPVVESPRPGPEETFADVIDELAADDEISVVADDMERLEVDLILASPMDMKMDFQNARPDHGENGGESSPSL